MPTYIGLANLHKAIVDRWHASVGLDAEFTQYWPTGASAEFTALNDGEGAAKQPWPYCVYLIASSRPTIRMTGGDNTLHEIRDVDLEFHIFAQPVGTTGAKEIAAALAASVIETFGGHPTTSPAPITVLGGDILMVKFNGEVSMRGGRIGSDEEWKWIVRYQIRQDVEATIY